MTSGPNTQAPRLEPAPSALMQEALRLVKSGLAVFPLLPRSKVPIQKGGFHGASRDLSTVRGWWTKWPSANIGLPTGAINDLVVLDIDPRNGGEMSLAELVAEGLEIPESIEVITGGGGRHLYFRHSTHGFPCHQNLLGKPGLDFKSNGGYVVCPPSIHESGNFYKFIGSLILGKDRLSPLSSTLIELLTKAGRRGSRGASVLPARLIHGQRNATLFKNACSLARGGGGEFEIFEWLSIVNRTRCEPPLPQDQIQTIARSAARYTPASSKRPVQ